MTARMGVCQQRVAASDKQWFKCVLSRPVCLSQRNAAESWRRSAAKLAATPDWSDRPQVWPHPPWAASLHSPAPRRWPGGRRCRGPAPWLPRTRRPAAAAAVPGVLEARGAGTHQRRHLRAAVATGHNEQAAQRWRRQPVAVNARTAAIGIYTLGQRRQLDGRAPGTSHAPTVSGHDNMANRSFPQTAAHSTRAGG